MHTCIHKHKMFKSFKNLSFEPLVLAYGFHPLFSHSYLLLFLYCRNVTALYCGNCPVFSWLDTELSLLASPLFDFHIQFYDDFLKRWYDYCSLLNWRPGTWFHCFYRILLLKNVFRHLSVALRGSLLSPPSCPFPQVTSWVHLLLLRLLILAPAERSS